MGTLLMEGIIYTNIDEALQDLLLCKEISESSPVTVGTGIHFSHQVTNYTYIIKHPTSDRWSLIADEKVENRLNKISVTLTQDWFPQNPMS